ncbi:hypothetical protein BDY19DRAFT_1067041 [Irpex rosettiformis]|uniref:Uncharacterized protein n=1 Tax=Irpex rosettiformis TaxID=378272 RepID=A0ACB8UBK6_9APHY|nr:hypothetical protein BDY19DRAFT_1067041 [Irpex rosettiformis]
MTSRLKRKLNDLGVDPASSKANENFCLIGTPLPPLEKSKDTGEFVPLWKQDVRDEKGRRRLHGAFTGGFSAGYFNTVGSKEGWTPATFTSSRSARSKAKTARPEDFMDDEDLTELRDSRQLVDENEEMDFVAGGTAAELRRRGGIGGEEDEDSITSALASTLAPPAQDSVGARILKKMGWRMGQGIGPRITYEQRRAQDFGAEEDVEVDEEARKHLYPRRDTPLIIVPRKDNSHGLGYTPGMGLVESLGQGASGSGSSSQAKGPRISAGFGLGALNDADEDDLDVYDSSLPTNSRLHHSRRVAYDENEDDNRITMGKSGSSRVQQSQNSRVGDKTQTFGDGRPVLKGFILSDQPVVGDKWFPIPDPPAGWRPNPRLIWDKENAPASSSAKRKERAEPKSHQEWKNSLLSVDERGSLLGETPLPSGPRSVFEYMSSKDREKLERIKHGIESGDIHRPPSPSQFIPQRSKDTIGAEGQIIIPQLHPSIAKAALSGFQPFTSDPVKQSRYTAFLQFTSSSSHDIPTSTSTGLGIGPMPDQTVEAFNKELDDYAKAATVFKPLSGAMAGRFRSAVVIENGPRIIEGLHTPSASASSPSHDREGEGMEEEKTEDPRTAAVRLGMYGPLTREVSVWVPAKLLCKRFGVKEPEVELDELADSAPKAASNVNAEFGDTSGSASQPLAVTDGTPGLDDGSSKMKKAEKRNLANIGLGEDDTQGADTLTYQRPAMDVFKAIFASDDEDSDDEDSGEAPTETAVVPTEAVKTEIEKGKMKAEESSVSLSSPSKPNEVAEKIDLATFKPTFVPRSERHAKEKDKDRDREKERKKKKKKTKTLVSFDDGEGEEGGDGGLALNVKPEKRKDRGRDKDGERKKKRRRGEADEDEDDMWVEAPPPEAVQNLNFDFTAASGPVPIFGMPVEDSKERSQKDESEGLMGPPRGRKRAVDFM